MDAYLHKNAVVQAENAAKEMHRALSNFGNAVHMIGDTLVSVSLVANPADRSTMMTKKDLMQFKMFMDRCNYKQRKMKRRKLSVFTWFAHHSEDETYTVALHPTNDSIDDIPFTCIGIKNFNKNHRLFKKR